MWLFVALTGLGNLGRGRRMKGGGGGEGGYKNFTASYFSCGSSAKHNLKPSAGSIIALKHVLILFACKFKVCTVFVSNRTVNCT